MLLSVTYTAQILKFFCTFAHSDAKPGGNYNGQQPLPDRRVNEHEQQSASSHGMGMSVQFEQRQRNSPAAYQQLAYSNNNMYQGELNQRMGNMKVDNIYPGMFNC
jgi:hypothetical protein